MASYPTKHRESTRPLRIAGRIGPKFPAPSGIDRVETAKAVDRLRTCYADGYLPEFYAVAVDAWERGLPVEFRVGETGGRS